MLTAVETLASANRLSNGPRMFRIYDAGAAGGRLSTACDAVRSQDRTGDLGVDADRVAPKIQGKLFRRSVDLERLRSPVRHVAVDAGARESLSDLGGHWMPPRLMTRQALLDKRRHVTLRTMNVMARRARHARARAKTLAALQQRHLIPVDVRGRRRVRGRGEIVVEVVTRSVGERRYFWVPLSGVAQGAVVHLPVPGETRGIEDIASARVRRMRCLILDVGSPVPMTFFAGDAEYVVARVPRRIGDRADRERRAVAFQAVGDDESPKVDLAVHGAGAIDPPLDPKEIGGGQLEQQPASPVEVGLPASPRPDHQLDALGSRLPPGRVDGGLIEDVIAPLHCEVDTLRPGAQDVAASDKLSFDGPSTGIGGCVEVGGLAECGDDLPVARLARVGGRRTS